jgi:hypothetical protein
MSQSGKVIKEFGSISEVRGGSIDLVSGSGALGAVNLSTVVTDIQSTGAATGTLSNGSQGKRKVIVMTVHGGDYVLTPANANGFATVTFSAVNKSVELVFINGKWNVVSATATVA